MNTQFHTPSFGDEIFDVGDASTSTPSSFVSGNQVQQKNINSSYTYQQQTPPTTKRIIRLLNTSDEYYTANEESFNLTGNNSMNSPIVQQNSNNALLAGNATPNSATTAGLTTMAARKQMLPLEQSEPAKPLSAYALFFRDTVSAIKQQNPSCSFQELSKIVSSMWDALDPVHKGVYNKKNEMAKIEYLKQMKVYQQLKQQQLYTNANETAQNTTNPQNQQQVAAPQVTPASQPTTNAIYQQNSIQINNNAANTNSSVPATATNTTAAPSDDQIRLLSEAGSVQKCTRENCNKRAIINPDWEDEYCSNECVIIHCRNVFNAWVQSNLEAKQQ